MQSLTNNEPLGHQNAPTEGMTHSSYATLLKDRGFQSFLWTQFLGAFNDNGTKAISIASAASRTDETSAWRALATSKIVPHQCKDHACGGQVSELPALNDSKKINAKGVYSSANTA